MAMNEPAFPLEGESPVAIYPLELGSIHSVLRGGFLAPVSGGDFPISVSGVQTPVFDHPPADEEGYLEFARNLQRPDIFQVIREAEKLSPLMPYRFGTNLRLL